MTKVLLEFFEELEKLTGMRGFMIMDDLQDLQESSQMLSFQSYNVSIG
jgi:hypothetical protein